MSRPAGSWRGPWPRRRSPEATDRLAGLNQVLAEEPRLQLAAQAEVDWSREAAADAVEGLVLRHQRLQLAWAASDGMALGALDAARRAGIADARRWLVAGLNWSKDGLAAIRDGGMLVAVGGHFAATGGRSTSQRCGAVPATRAIVSIRPCWRAPDQPKSASFDSRPSNWRLPSTPISPVSRCSCSVTVFSARASNAFPALVR